MKNGVIFLLLIFTSAAYGQFLEYDEFYEVPSNYGRLRTVQLKFDSEYNRVRGVEIKADFTQNELQKSFKIIKLNVLNEVVWEKTFRTKTSYPNLNCVLNDLVVDEEDNIYIAGNFKDTLHIDGEDFLYSNFGVSDFLCKISPEGDVLWARSFGNGEAYQIGSVVRVFEDEVFYGGLFQDSLFLNDDTLVSRGGNDCFLLKLNDEGELSFGKQFGSTSNATLSAMTVDDHGVYVSGRFSDTIYFESEFITLAGLTDVFIAKYGKNGELKWSKGGGGVQHDNPTDIVLLQDRVFVSGSFTSTATFGETELIGVEDVRNFFITCLDTLGEFIWTKGSFSQSHSHPNGMAASDNSVYFSAHFSGLLDFNGYSLDPSNGKVLLCKMDASGEITKIQYGLGLADFMDIRDSLIGFGGSEYAGYQNDLKIYKAFMGIAYKNSFLSNGEFDGEFNIFPNPFTDQLNLVNLEAVERIFIYDASGRLVYEKKELLKNELISLGHLQMGVYIIHIQDRDPVIVVKSE